MLSKPVERCRKTSYSLNLSLVLSVLNALYKLLEKFCCILSLKKHLQAIHISVQSAHRTSLRRPAARRAARKSASPHALRVVRSSGELSSSRSASSGAVGLLRPDETLTVACTIGSREQSSPASPSTRCSSAPRPIHGLDRGDLRGLGVAHAQSRMLGREQMAHASGSRIALMGAPTSRSRGRGGSTASPGTPCSR
jgi:hypothetical protein